MSVPSVRLKSGKAKYLREGYPWIFRNLIQSTKGEPASGDVVRIFGDNDVCYGQGLYHIDSQIAVRFLTNNPHRAIDRAFWKERIEAALRRRRAVLKQLHACRLIFSESDGLPGTVVDKYGPVLTWSTLSYGMEQRREIILDILEEMLEPTAIIERNDHWLREKDGLEKQTGILRGQYGGPILIEEGDLRFSVDVLKGPKTGFFLDQVENRLRVGSIAEDRRVLDVFCADGGFGLHAAAGGASSVQMIDISTPALERVQENAERNNLSDRISIEQADALRHLGELVQNGEQYDLIILDPPAFAKSRRHIERATRAYQRLNICAWQLLGPGGLLATASCSPALDEQSFLDIVRYSARKAGTGMRILHRGSQPADHPVLDAMAETKYLKFYLLEKMADDVPGIEHMIDETP